jgi:predicted nucleic acid-binding Zn ribbon protein
LREKPITRDEVRLTKGGTLATLPKRGYQGRRAKQPLGFFHTVYCPKEDLWRSLLRKLDVEMPKPIRYPPKTCVLCGKQFFFATYDRGHGPYVCSDKCADKRRNLARRYQRLERSKGRQKLIRNRACLYCGSAVKATRVTKRYCSGRCRVAAHRRGPSGVLR